LAGALLSIYEVVHRERRESLVVLTPLPPDALEALLRDAPPPETRHWEPGGVSIEQLARNMPPEDAEEFAAAFLPTLAGTGWTARLARF
jgi:hypothetical protein